MDNRIERLHKRRIIESRAAELYEALAFVCEVFTPLLKNGTFNCDDSSLIRKAIHNAQDIIRAINYLADEGNLT